MESSQFVNITRNLLEAFEKLQVDLKETQEQCEADPNVVIETVRTNINDNWEKEIEFDRKKLMNNLDDVMTVTNGFIPPDNVTDDQLTLCLRYLNTVDEAIEQQDDLINTLTKEIKETQVECARIECETQFINDVVERRKNTGEYTVFKGYTAAEFKQIEQKSKFLFRTHREKMKAALRELYPNNEKHDKISQLLAILCENAYHKDGKKYLNIDDHPELRDDVIHLFNLEIVERHPQQKKLIQLRILN